MMEGEGDLLVMAKSGTPVKGDTRDTDMVGPGGEGALPQVSISLPL